MGVTDRLAGEVAIDVGVVELADEQRTFSRLAACGCALRDQHGAGVVVMGCAGMARYRAALEDSLAIPVVEPTQAAVTMAIGRARLGGTAKRFGGPANVR
jgi:Asp/Glu/hydantoin racemase